MWAVGLLYTTLKEQCQLCSLYIPLLTCNVRRDGRLSLRNRMFEHFVALSLYVCILPLILCVDLLSPCDVWWNSCNMHSTQSTLFSALGSTMSSGVSMYRYAPSYYSMCLSVLLSFHHSDLQCGAVVLTLLLCFDFVDRPRLSFSGLFSFLFSFCAIALLLLILIGY